MLYRSIYIGNPTYLRLKDAQMKIICPETKAERGSIPIEDMGLLMLDHAQITLSHQLVQSLMLHNVVLVSCDERHLPQGMMLPLHGHSSHTQRIRRQIDISEPLRKRIWKQTIECKIANQIAVLRSRLLEHEPMYGYLSAVRSGDTSNMEGIAAQYYWRSLFGREFYRDREGEGANSLLNFGYAVLRSIVARAIVDAGLLPALGIFHRNKYNPYCLADDLMEPYRPYIDRAVLAWLDEHPIAYQLDQEAKAYLLRQATADVAIDGELRPLLVAVRTSVSSFYRCLIGEKRQVSFPLIT